MITEQQAKWLKRTEELFLRYGIKSITMDDVARELGISKKTLYQFVDNKNDLVCKVLEHHVQEEVQKDQCRHQEAADAIDEMIEVIRNVADEFRRIKSHVVYELQKYHRECWDKVQSYQDAHVHRIIRENLERGIREGLYRPDFDPDILAKLYMTQVGGVFDDRIFPYPQYQPDKVFQELIMQHLYGIVSEKGLQLLKAKLS